MGRGGIISGKAAASGEVIVGSLAKGSLTSSLMGESTGKEVEQK